jgi:hypothetical protein
VPVEFLRDIAIMDTPGTNSVVRQHQEITEDFIPRADLVLFITSIDRPLTESERQFLSYIQQWGWHDTLDYFNTQVHKSEYEEQIVGRIGGQFVYECEEVYARLRREAETRINSLDHREVCRRVVDNALGVLQQSAGLSAGAVGWVTF